MRDLFIGLPVQIYLFSMSLPSQQRWELGLFVLLMLLWSVQNLPGLIRETIDILWRICRFFWSLRRNFFKFLQQPWEVNPQSNSDSPESDTNSMTAKSNLGDKNGRP